MFEVKWYKLRMNECDPEKTIIEHANGFTMVSIRTVELSIKPCVLPSQCEQVFYSEVLGKVGWSYIVRYNPRGSLVKCNVAKEDDVEEQVDVLEEEIEEVELDVDDNVLNDHINDEIIENDTNDDVDMANPFNVNFELYDIDVELDQ
jgi:hypothetical protein